MQKDEFENLVGEAIGDLPEHIRAKMDNVAVVVEDAPSQQQMRRGGTRQGDILLGLYEGVPQNKRGPGYTMVLPDKISIFQNSIERVARTPALIKQQVRETIWHEIAHHFGFNEQAIRDLEKQRRSK